VGRWSYKSPFVNELVVIKLLGRTGGSGGAGRPGRSLGTRSRAAKVLRAVVTGTVAGHAHVVGRGRGRTVGSTYARVVLRSAPAQADTRVANGVTLHLVDGHLGGVTVDELDETATLARRDLDIRDLTETLEEGPQLVLGDVAGETTDEDGGVVGVSELVHLGSGIEATVEALGSVPHLLLGHNTAAHHGAVVLAVAKAVVATVLGGGGRDAHGSVAAVDTLHLDKSPLLIVLVGEADESVATALTGHGIRHDLGGLARGETGLEQGHQNVFVDFRAEVANENAVLGATVVPTVNESTTRGPVQLELTRAVGNRGAVKAKGLGSSVGGLELDEAVTSVAGVLVTDNLNIDGFTGGRKEDTLDEVLIHPGLELSHPESRLRRLLASAGWRGNGSHVGVGRGAVGERHLVGRSATIGRDARERSVERVHFGQCRECSDSQRCESERCNSEDVAKLR